MRALVLDICDIYIYIYILCSSVSSTFELQDSTLSLGKLSKGEHCVNPQMLLFNDEAGMKLKSLCIEVILCFLNLCQFLSTLHAFFKHCINMHIGIFLPEVEEL